MKNLFRIQLKKIHNCKYENQIKSKLPYIKYLFTYLHYLPFNELFIKNYLIFILLNYKYGINCLK